MKYLPGNSVEERFFHFLLEQACLFSQPWPVFSSGETSEATHEASINPHGIWNAGVFQSSVGISPTDANFQVQTLLSDSHDLPIAVWIDYDPSRSTEIFQIWWQIGACAYTHNSEQSNYWPNKPVLSLDAGSVLF